MSDKTDRLKLPFLLPGQSQKEVTINESLLAVDTLLHGALQGPPRNTPPENPAPGETWLIGDAPSAEWAGRQGQVAAYTQGGWRYFQPVPGMTFWSVADACPVHFSDGVWINGLKPSAQLPTIADPSGGTTVDAPARAAIVAILQRLRAIGAVG